MKGVDASEFKEVGLLGSTGLSGYLAPIPESGHFYFGYCLDCSGMKSTNWPTGS